MITLPPLSRAHRPTTALQPAAVPLSKSCTLLSAAVHRSTSSPGLPLAVPPPRPASLLTASTHATGIPFARPATLLPSGVTPARAASLLNAGGSLPDSLRHLHVADELHKILPMQPVAGSFAHLASDTAPLCPSGLASGERTSHNHDRESPSKHGEISF